MSKQDVILIFDVGKTNKKVLLFDDQYQIVSEEIMQLKETVDEDGFACEDVNLLTNWIQQKFNEVLLRKDVAIKAINFSAYGASFVHLDDAHKPLTPLYNYLKPYPEKLRQKFYDTYGDENMISRQTASPVLGSLNSGMQLYRLKYEQPRTFSCIKKSLHLPQYLSFILSKKTATDISSVGCHTSLWDFEKNDYHKWVYKEGLNKKFARLYSGNTIITAIDDTLKIGIGLHDSSAALIPYLISFSEPFILISTGTWSISLNPFNHSPLTDEELNQDCLCYLSYEGKPIKASRLFAGNEHDKQVKRLADHFNKSADYYKTIMYDNAIIKSLHTENNLIVNASDRTSMQSSFSKRTLHAFKTYGEAYHQLMFDIITQQIFSTKLVLNDMIKQIFVDGGFGSNDVYMNLLASSFPDIKIYAASIAQASALGAAVALGQCIISDELSSNLIQLKLFKSF